MFDHLSNAVMPMMLQICVLDCRLSSRIRTGRLITSEQKDPKLVSFPKKILEKNKGEGGLVSSQESCAYASRQLRGLIAFSSDLRAHQIGTFSDWTVFCSLQYCSLLKFPYLLTIRECRTKDRRSSHFRSSREDPKVPQRFCKDDKPYIKYVTTFIRVFCFEPAFRMVPRIFCSYSLQKLTGTNG